MEVAGRSEEHACRAGIANIPDALATGGVFFSRFSTMIRPTLPRIPKTMGPLRGNRGRSRADPRRILALSCLSALHNIETTLRSIVPPAAELHAYTWCTTSVRDPPSHLLRRLLAHPPPNSGPSSFSLRSTFFVPRHRRCFFSSLITIFAFAERKRAQRDGAPPCPDG